MKNYNGWNQLNKYIQEHNSFNLYYKNEFFAKFDYDEKTKKYQSAYGWLSLKKTFELAKDLEQNRKIEWIDNYV